MKFRKLRADEVDCRISTISDKGLSLLLYKDARCDMNILDETVGPMNWQRSHSRDNANCTVSIYDTEKEKGLASDSFKRACFNWGIGRELYTAPFIWIGADKCKLVNRNGKFTCYDKFKVEYIEYDDSGNISFLCIANVSEMENQRKRSKWNVQGS